MLKEGDKAPAFSATEEEKIEKAKFRSKPKTLLSRETSLDFNGAKLILEYRKKQSKFDEELSRSGW